MTLRDLPRVDGILAHPELTRLAAPRRLARAAAREAIAEARVQVQAKGAAADPDAVARRAAELLRLKLRPSLRRAINATGVVLHTGLGRAPLSAAAAQALAEVAAGYSNIQADVGSGERMPREVHVEDTLRELTGAEAAAVVNNNAAATVLVLNTLAAGKEVLISRGEMVEIGGAFRLPDIVRLSGCRLVEVGCTNRTHLRDYRRAITPDTALLLPVHQSNYRITGFTAAPDLVGLVALAREHGIACAHDLGSGALHELTAFGLPHEPTVQGSLAAGVDVVFFSGDKLLGGPQCGLILGKRAVIEAMRANPYYRTFRVDKLILAALEATLRLFLDEETVREQHRVTHLLTRSEAEIHQQADALAAHLQSPPFAATVVSVVSEIGGGSLAGAQLPSWAVRLTSLTMSAEELAARLRLHDPPIFARLHADAVLLDLRSLLPGDDEAIVTALAHLPGPGR
jgi:L-seryl-tRNA(Ser) seleniumtransferase